MTTVPILATIGGAVALGALNLKLRLEGKRKPILLGVHLLLGIGALEVLVFYLRDANGGEGVPAGPYGNIAAALLAIAVFIGLLSPIIAKNSRSLSNALLVAHVASGSLGAVTALVWASRL